MTIPAAFFQLSQFWGERHKWAVLCGGHAPTNLARTSLQCHLSSPGLHFNAPPCTPTCYKTKFEEGITETVWQWSWFYLAPPTCKSNLFGIPALQTRRQDFNRKIFTEGFLLHNLLILISLPLWLNVNFTLRTAIANLNTFYLFMAFKILVLEMSKPWGFSVAVWSLFFLFE